MNLIDVKTEFQKCVTPQVYLAFSLRLLSFIFLLLSLPDCRLRFPVSFSSVFRLSTFVLQLLSFLYFYLVFPRLQTPVSFFPSHFSPLLLQLSTFILQLTFLQSLDPSGLMTSNPILFATLFRPISVETKCQFLSEIKLNVARCRASKVLRPWWRPYNCSNFSASSTTALPNRSI